MPHPLAHLKNQLIDEIVWSPSWEFGEIQAIYGERAEEMKKIIQDSNERKIELLREIKAQEEADARPR